MNSVEKIKLTQYSHGAGCGCKIAPKILEEILSTSHNFNDSKLLVGNSTKDDAAVYDIGNGQAVISTTDFFMPIVDDPEIFGQIASVNAISDIYAMGGKPIMAIAILGWPVKVIPASVAQQVLEGSRQICAKAGIPLAGGHSIDCPEPVFGLAVTGLASIKNIKRNDTAQPGDKLYLTKPLGIGIVTTAQKKGLVKKEDLDFAIQNMLTLNDIGFELGKLDYIHALTDVTGFGLLGHLQEICEGSNVAAKINFEDVPVMPFVENYLERNCTPGGTARNWESYGHRVSSITERQKNILCDPQTSGGLLIAVAPEKETDFRAFMMDVNFDLKCFGTLTYTDNQMIKVV